MNNISINILVAMQSCWQAKRYFLMNCTPHKMKSFTRQCTGVAVIKASFTTGTTGWNDLCTGRWPGIMHLAFQNIGMAQYKIFPFLTVLLSKTARGPHKTRKTSFYKIGTLHMQYNVQICNSLLSNFKWKYTFPESALSAKLSVYYEWKSLKQWPQR